MPDDRSRIYWDSCVFLDYLNDGDSSVIPGAIVDRAERGEIQLVTSTLSIAEVAYVAHEKAGGALTGPAEQKIDELWSDSSVITLIEFDRFVARAARTLIRLASSQGRGLRSSDAVQLASALVHRVAAFHTTDAKLLSLAPTLGLAFPVTPPTTPQLPLDLTAS